MSFKPQNIIKHKLSTALGLVLLVVLLTLPLYVEKLSYSEVTPLLLVVIPFLLYGNSNSENQKPL